MTLRKNITLLSWFNFFFNFRLYGAIAILYFADVTHSFALGASVFSIAQLTQALCEVPTGIVSDRWGRRACLIVGAMASLASVLCYANASGYALLVAGAICEGVCFALFSGNNDALLYETLNETEQLEAYTDTLGKVSSTMELAGFLSVLTGGLVATVSFPLVFWLSAIPQAVCVALSLGFREPAVHRATQESVLLHLWDALRAFRHNPRLRDLSVVNVLGVGIGESMWSLQATFYRTVLPVWAVGVVLSLNYLISAISYRLSGSILRRVKALTLLIASEIYTRILVVGALLFPTALSPFLMALASVTYGPTVVAQNGLLQGQFTDRQRATMASINALFGSLLFAVFALVLGAVADTWGALTAMLTAQACLLPIMFIYVKVRRDIGGSAV